MNSDLRQKVTGLLETALSQPSPLDRESEVMLYGAGGVGRDVHRFFLRQGVRVVAVLDRNAVEGEIWEGIQLLLPGDQRIAPDVRRRTLVIITIFNRETDLQVVVEGLRAHGYERITTFAEVYDHFAAEFGSRFWLTERNFYRAHAAEITEGLAVWDDEASRQTYAQTLEYRLTGNHQALPKPRPEEQYIPSDVPHWTTPIRFADCGAFDGDTISSLLNNGVRIEAVAAFEPDLENFVKLAAFVGNRLPATVSTVLWSCAVYSHTGLLSFNSGQGEGSRLDAAGTKLVPCVSLDAALFQFNPTLIKLDVEGAEFEALTGAQGIIDESQPGLAVCLYHRPEHLWKIPLTIGNWNGGYRLFLRSHGFNGFDLVLYAVPASGKKEKTHA
jgi:FkbM family methyltransferase